MKTHEEFDRFEQVMADEQSLIYRLRKRAEIRRQITTRKSVQENKIADLLEEAIERLEAAVCSQTK